MNVYYRFGISTKGEGITIIIIIIFQPLWVLQEF